MRLRPRPVTVLEFRLCSQVSMGLEGGVVGASRPQCNSGGSRLVGYRAQPPPVSGGLQVSWPDDSAHSLQQGNYFTIFSRSGGSVSV